MFRIVLLLFLFCGQPKETRLIVRGDDMGFCHAGNEALIKCFEEGIETSIEVIVPSPWFPEAVKLLQEHPKVDVGIHLALTSEWDNVKYRPVSWCPTLTDSSGYFFPKIWPDKNYPGQALTENKWTIEEVEKEIRAQIELGIKKIPRISHVSGHMGVEGMDKRVTALVQKLAKEYHLYIDLDGQGVTSVGYDGPSRTAEEKISSFSKTISAMQSGGTYLFVDHPCLNTPESRAIHHIGYENVAEDRQGVVDCWTSPKIRALIRSKGIRLISYAELKK